MGIRFNSGAIPVAVRWPLFLQRKKVTSLTPLSRLNRDGKVEVNIKPEDLPLIIFIQCFREKSRDVKWCRAFYISTYFL